jgi:DNA replication and repair protein RecF
VFLRKIKLSNFKNHETGEYLFTKKIHAFVGGNGVGKTNLLDLIYFLGLTKSFFNLTDQQLINKGKDYTRLEASLMNNEIDYDLLVKMPLGKRKEFFSERSEI